MSKVASKNCITLKGSAAIINEYLSESEFQKQYFNTKKLIQFKITALILFYFNEEFTQPNNSHQFSNMELLSLCLKMNESKIS